MKITFVLLPALAACLLWGCSKNNSPATVNDDSPGNKSVNFRVYRRQLSATDSTVVKFNIQLYKFTYTSDSTGSIVGKVWDTAVADQPMRNYPLASAPLTFTKVFPGFHKRTDQVIIRGIITERRSANTTLSFSFEDIPPDDPLSYITSIDL